MNPAETTEITTSLNISLDEPAVIISPEVTTTAAVTTTEVTETTLVQAADPELLQSVQNIESIMLYNFGITFVILAVLICSVIIKIFFQ